LPWNWYADPEVLRLEGEPSTKPGWASWWRSTPTSGWNRALVEGVQRGVRSGVLGEGRLLSESERLVAHFQRLCATALAR
jgi:hypothetical protein